MSDAAGRVRHAGAVEERLALGSAGGRWVLAAMVLGSGMAMLDGTVVNVARPAIQQDLGASAAGLQWTVNAYLLTLASLILLGGSLGDRLGRRRVFLVGVVWFAVASLGCALAVDQGTLIAARAVQGIGGALLTPGSLAIIEASFVKGDRARAIGAWSALGGIAAAIGPLLGGLLVDTVSWRAVFLLNLPLAVVVVLVALRHVPESRDAASAGRLDLLGAGLGALGLGGVTYALIEAPEAGTTSPAVLGAAVLGVVGIVGFVVAERRVASPMLPVDIFANRQFTTANLVTFTVYGALGSVFFLLVQHLQIVVGFPATLAGASALPITLLMLVGSARAGALAQRIGPKLPLTIGPLLLGVGMVLLGQIGEGATYVADVLPAVLGFGVGLTLTVAPVTSTTLAAADERHAGVASGVNNAVARVAQLLAIAVLPVVAGLAGAYGDPAAFSAGFTTAMRVAAGLAVAGAVIAFTGISNDVLEEDEAPQEPTPARAHHHAHCAVEGTPLRVRS